MAVQIVTECSEYSPQTLISNPPTFLQPDCVNLSYFI